MTAKSPSTTGRSRWFDLPAVNLADAMSFYEGLFQWEYAKMEESPLPDYVMIRQDGALIGGLRRVLGPLPDLAVFSSPVIYFSVDELASKIARVRELGGQIVGEAIDLGRGRGRYQCVRDRQGLVIGLWAPR